MIENRLLNRKIGIAGCGGLGSNIARFLIMAGYNNFVIVDFDKIEESNLNRQFYNFSQIGKLKAPTLKDNLLAINPKATIEAVNIKLSLENSKATFSGCDIIVEALDDKKNKAIFIEAVGFEKPVVAGSGIGGTDCGCIGVKRISPKFTVVGDFTSDIDENEVYGFKVNSVACSMCEQIVESLRRCYG